MAAITPGHETEERPESSVNIYVPGTFTAARPLSRISSLARDVYPKRPSAATPLVLV